MTRQSPFASFSISAVRDDDLAGLLRRVAAEHGRLEIRTGRGEACVVLSKAELQSLEHALAVLSDSEHGRRLHQTVAQAAAICARSA